VLEKLDVQNHPTLPQQSTSPPLLHHDDSVIIQSQYNQNALASSQEVLKLPDVADDVGLPADGIWPFHAVYQERFCFEHRKFEWLLGMPNRWMRPKDFEGYRVEVSLKYELREYERRPREFRASHRLFQAECDDSLWSLVDVPIKKAEFMGDIIYLIRWKAFWSGWGKSYFCSNRQTPGVSLGR
jgi:hypothetical protein